MKLAISGVKFSFYYLVYSQQDGIAMESPLGPTLVKIFMGFFELKVVPAFKNNSLYLNYVDNCFVFEARKLLINFMIFWYCSFLYKFHNKKTNDELAFLDVQKLHVQKCK